MTGYAGELKVSWWVCYLVIRTLLIGFSFVSFFFPFPPTPSHFAVRFLMRRSGFIRFDRFADCPFGGELFELKQRQRKMRGEIPLCETCLFLIRSFVLFLWILLRDLIFVFISQFPFRTRKRVFFRC